MVTDTKKKIIDASLDLFAKKGYEATSTVEIAKAVGIKAPSLYFHYKSKQDIFDTLVETMREHFNVSYPVFQEGVTSVEDAVEKYVNDAELTVRVTAGTFLFYFKDRYAGPFRRMLMIERYKNKEMDKVLRELYIDAPLEHQTKIFRGIMNKGYISSDLNPRTLAYQFYSPVFFLMNRYDGMPEAEAEALDEIEKHVVQFMGRYIRSKAD